MTGFGILRGRALSIVSPFLANWSLVTRGFLPRQPWPPDARRTSTIADGVAARHESLSTSPGPLVGMDFYRDALVLGVEQRELTTYSLSKVQRGLQAVLVQFLAGDLHIGKEQFQQP